MEKFNVGDIVFVSKYSYKNGENGTNHSFVIIDDGQAMDINYFGFLISSQTHKATYLYNEELNKDNVNNLKKDSIVKCDDLINFVEPNITCKIGEVPQSDFQRFINTYAKYLETV